MSDWTDAGPAAAIAPGEWVVVDVDDVEVAVFNIDGEFHAIENVCTHDYGELAGPGCLDGSQVICPRHGARFDVCTGEALTPPAYEPVARLQTRVEDGRVLVRDPRWD